MGPEKQPGDIAVAEMLLGGAGHFDFFQAVRLIQRIASGNPVGYDPLPEMLRFKSVASLTFPPSSVVAVQRRPDPKRQRAEYEMTVSLMGLTGPAGVLPHHYTRLLIERVRQKDFALKDFLDIFNHRLISFFFRAWEKCHFPAAYEKSRIRNEKEDLFTGALFSLVGLGTRGLRGRSDFDDEALLFYSGLFADQHRPEISLRRMLADYFEVPVAIEQFRGRWIRLNMCDRSALPSEAETSGRNCQLGVDIIVGEQVWDVQGMFRVRIGPLTFSQFRHWIPTGDTLRPLAQLIRTYVGLSFEFDVQVVLKGSEIPLCHLGGTEGNEPLLGWTTWLLYGLTEPDRPDAADPVFVLDEI